MFAEKRYQQIKNWTFITERQIKLQDEEYSEFTVEICRINWTKLAQPLAKFDEDVVREFYANAWPTEGQSNELKSKVRGTWICYDRNVIN